MESNLDSIVDGDGRLAHARTNDGDGSGEVYRRVLAFGFGGTLAEKGRVPLALHTALEQLRAAGHVLFMMTGQRFGDAGPSPLGDVGASIVGKAVPRFISPPPKVHIPVEKGKIVANERILVVDDQPMVIQMALYSQFTGQMRLGK